MSRFRTRIRLRSARARAGRRALLATVARLSAPAGTAAAAKPSASVTATIKIAIRSVTVSTTSLTFASCSGGSSSAGALGFPNGTCATPRVTVSNGSAPATIMVTGANAVPSDGGRQWTLCGGAGSPSCGGASPQTDQFTERALTVELGLTPTCDQAFGTSPCGVATPGQTASESLTLVGPTISTDTSPRFSTAVTWTAT